MITAQLTTPIPVFNKEITQLAWGVDDSVISNAVIEAKPWQA